MDYALINLTTNVLTDFLDLRSETNVSSSGNSLEFEVASSRGYTINNGHKFKLYGKPTGLLDINNLDSESDYVLGTYTVLRLDKTDSTYRVKVSCGDFTYTMLSNLYAKPSAGVQVTEIINDIVQLVQPDGISQETQATQIQEYKSDGSAFPEIDYISKYKTSYDVILELSGTTYTEDNKSYIFWFEPDGSFVWKYPYSTIEPTQFIYPDFEAKNFKSYKSDLEVVNFVIYDAGTDKDGSAISDIFQAKKLKAGGGTKFQAFTDTSALIKKQLGVAYDTVSNSEFVRLVKARADAKAQAYITGIGAGLQNMSFDIIGQNILVGRKYKVGGSITEANELRLTKVIQKMGKNGWKTSLTFEEDEEND